MDMSKYRCTQPFSHLHVKPRGVVTPCCLYDWTKNDSWKRDNSSYGLKIQKGIDNILHSDEWRKIQDKSNNNIKEAGCWNCYFREEAGSTSRRMWMNERHPDGDKEIKLINLELQLGAKCNLECRMCSSGNSNKLLKEDSMTYFGKLDKEWMRKTQEYSNWIYDEKVWDDIKKHSKHLQVLQFAGGEPLLIQQQYDYLEWLAENNLDPIIQYITNATIGVDDYKKTVWNNFSDVSFDFSIDGVGATGEYLRTGSVWEKQVENIKSYIAYREERKKLNKDTRLHWSTCISIMNITEIKPILDFMYDLGLEKSNWSLNIVSEPDWMDVENLYGKEKRYALSKIQEILDDSKYQEKHKKTLQTVVSRIGSNPSDTLDFIEKIVKKDTTHNTVNQSRKIDYPTTFPQWWNVLTN
tara:strand:+ start:335 stop:1564 length:1230 start_codon:yes stop_codon:yes gene_type:complete